MTIILSFQGGARNEDRVDGSTNSGKLFAYNENIRNPILEDLFLCLFIAFPSHFGW